MITLVKKIGYTNLFQNSLLYLLTAILFFSGITKIINPTPFIEILRAAFKFSDDINFILAAFLPFIELSLAFLLIFKIKPKETLLAITVLFFCFFTFITELQLT